MTNTNLEAILWYVSSETAVFWLRLCMQSRGDVVGGSPAVVEALRQVPTCACNCRNGQCVDDVMKNIASREDGSEMEMKEHYDCPTSIGIN